jgi:dipeptidyl aminopeptidase/acylaminoacyl peptidase
MKMTPSLAIKLAARLVAAGVGLNASAAGVPAPASAVKPLPTEAFFKKAALGSPTLSPSGKKIAMLVPTASGRIGLAVADVGTPDKFKGIAQFDDADIATATWINDERLVFGLHDRKSPMDDQLDRGLYAVNADGSKFVWLIERTWAGMYSSSHAAARRALSYYAYDYLRPIYDGSDDVLVLHSEPTPRGTAPKTQLMRLNTKTMGLRHLSASGGPKGAAHWITDPELRPRVVVANDGANTGIVYWRDLDKGEWTELYRYDQFGEKEPITPLAVDSAGQLYVSAPNPKSPDGTTALYRYDVKRRQLEDEPLVNLPGYDYEGSVIFDKGTKQMLGASYKQETAGVAWFDPRMRAAQEAVDKLLPSTNNFLSCTYCTTTSHMVVTATSDVQAPVYFLFDRENGKLSLLGASHPWLNSADMAGTQDFQRIKARDGMQIPVYVTKPRGKGPWPTGVLVHGGPYVRGVEWGFDPQTQFLASRGYLVIEPEFRGSTGYGSKLFRAGWKQWGLAMQDDITDATRWAIDQGLADPKRIAIAGASYGGYATMMGLVKEPGLYKVGINWVGVTDIEMMYSIGWSDFMDRDNPWVRFGMPKMIGDPSKDEAQLTATSPLKQAHRIKQPVLMAYGEEDYRVPLPHGKKMRDALLETGNKNVEWVQYPKEGHGWYLTENNVDFWNRVERFLEKNLK